MPTFKKKKNERTYMHDWRPPIAFAEKVDAEAYKIIFEEAKERFEECASESESITERSIKILLGVISVGAFCIGIFSSHPQAMVPILPFAGLLIVE